MSTPAQIAANRQNATKSSGPVTEEGKAASAQNNFRHGFRSKFAIAPSEGQEEFDALLNALVEEHNPQTVTEHLLVSKLAEHYWLTQRARNMQHDALNQRLVKDWQLLTRYETQNDRAFHKCLDQLLKLREEKRKAEIGFERQKQAEAEQARKQEAHEAKLRLATAKAQSIEIETEIKSIMHAPIPGRQELTFDDMKKAMRYGLSYLAHERAQEQAA